MTSRYLALTILLAACGCAPDGAHMPLPGPTSANTISPQGKPAANNAASETVTYGDVKPIFKQYCSRCHPAMILPDWQNYSMAKVMVDNGKLKQRLIVEKTMPLLGSPESQAIQQSDRDLIGKWIAGGGQP